MAQKQKADTAAAPAGPRNGPLGILTLALSAIVAAAGTMFVLSPDPGGVTQACPTGLESDGPIAPMSALNRAYVEMEEILVTIGQSPADRYLKLNISVITPEGKTGAVKKSEPMLRDAFIGYLRAVELRDFEDPAFYAELRRQLARRAELVLGESGSDGILITEFLLR